VVADPSNAEGSSNGSSLCDRWAFGTGSLPDLIGLPFSTIFAAGSIVALPLAVTAALIIHR
jgi:hypothetical protein